MTEKLPEPERPDDRLDAATAQRGMHLARQHPSRRTGNDDFDLFRIQHAADEALPARYQLDFVEEPCDRLASPELGESPEELLQQGTELVRGDIRQAIIVETQVDGPFRVARGKFIYT